MIKKALLYLGLILSMLTVCAEDNVLQSIEIVPVKDTYNIVLTADKSVDVKKTVQAPNKITLDLKGIRASKTLNTIYNNVSNVDTVMVEPSGNGVNIFFQAENAQNASIAFDSIAPVIPEKQATKTEQVKLNSPIDTYAPIYREELAQQKTSELFKKLTNKSEMLSDEIQDSIPETLNKFFSYGLIGLFLFGAMKLFRKKEPDMKIGLSGNLNEREIDMYKNSQPIGISYGSMDKPFTTVNYGLNAYRKESQDPYETPAIHNPRLRNYVNQQSVQRDSVQTITKPAIQSYTAPTRQQTTVKGTSTVQSNPNIDNLKFLESMTAIYEKSGRHDLAQGLKASLSKNNIRG